MSHRRSSFPTLQHHVPSGRAVVTVRLPNGNRKDYYCGPWGSPEAEIEYRRIIGELAVAGLAAAGNGPPPAVDLTVNEVIVAFKRHADVYYRLPDGTLSTEVDNFRLSLRPLRTQYGHTRATAFGPLALKAVQGRMAADGLSRSVVNQRVGRIRRVFKWAASEQLIPFAVYQSLTTVPGLRRGRSPARESEPVRPVEEATARAVLPHVLPAVAAMIELQLLTGMRPGEVCRMRPADVDTSGGVWLYRPERHKTAHLGRGRTVPLGPRAQAVLARFVPARPEDYFFSPAAAMAALRQSQRSARPARPSPRICPTPESRRRTLSPCYNPRSFAKAVAVGCRRTRVDHFHPNQIRHTLATEVRKRFGLEAAQVLLGHSRADVTQVYAERDESLAVHIAEQMG